MPGHLRQALAAHPELRLPGSTDALDISLPAARRFCRELILEYLDLFGGRYWHAGADEYQGATGEAYVDFINWIDRLVRARGRTLRIWHDGLSGDRLNRDVIVEWWADHAGPSPKRLLLQGHRVLNAGWWPTYYVAGGPLSAVHPSVKVAYETWQVNLFGGLAINSPTPANPLQRVSAAAAACWARAARLERRPVHRNARRDRARNRAAAAVLARRPGTRARRRAATTGSCACGIGSADEALRVLGHLPDAAPGRPSVPQRLRRAQAGRLGAGGAEDLRLGGARQRAQPDPQAGARPDRPELGARARDRRGRGDRGVEDDRRVGEGEPRRRGGGQGLATRASSRRPSWRRASP